MNLTSRSKITEPRGGGPRKPTPGKIYPYKVLCDRKKGMVFEDYENVWCYTTMIKPGESNFFLVYRYEPGV